MRKKAMYHYKRYYQCLVIFFFLMVGFFYSSVSFGEDLKHRLFKGCLHRIMNRFFAPTPKDVYGVWSDEVTAVMKGMLSTTQEGVDLDLISTVNRMLKTPEDALAVIRQQKIEGINSSVVPFLKRYAEREKVVRGVSQIRPISCVELPSSSSSGYSERHLKRYYQMKIEGLLSEVEPVLRESSGMAKELEGAIGPLGKFFSKKEFVTQVSEAEVATMTNEFLNAQATKIDGVVKTFFEEIGVAHKPIDEVILARTLKRGVQKLQDLSKCLKQYGGLLVTRGVFDGKDFFLAQIRFSDLEVKKMALQQLLTILDSRGVVLSKAELREIFSHPNHQFRRYVLDVFRKREGITVEAVNGADAELIRSLDSFPGEISFEEAAETIAVLLMVPPHMEIALVKGWELAQRTIEKVAIIRALGHLETEEAFEILVNHHSKAMVHPRLIRAYAEEIASGLRVFPERFEQGKRVLWAMIESEDVIVRREGIRGLGVCLDGGDPIFQTLLAKEKDPLVQAQILVVMSSAPGYEKTGSEVALTFAEREMTSTNLNLKAAASLYLFRKGGTKQYAENGVVGFLEILSGEVFPSHEYQLLLLRELRDKFSDLSMMKEVIIKFVNQIGGRENPGLVCLEALSILAKAGAPEGAHMLLEIFDKVSGSLKRKVIDLLVSGYQDKDIFRKAVKKIIELYEHPLYEFDFFDNLGREAQFFKKIKLLQGDHETVELLMRLRNSSETSFGLRRFVDQTLTEIQ